jgi:cation diffusion facilitator family transporter
VVATRDYRRWVSEADRPPVNGSLLTVLIAFLANLLIAIAKSVAAFLTGSASMVAEAAHSWADAGNEIFLLVADRKSDRERDVRHPLGYGREAYVWSMFAAFGLFTAGAVVSIMHGVQELIHPEPASDFGVAYVVLAVAFVLEGISFTQAWREARKRAREAHPETGGRGSLRMVLELILNTSNPTLRAVFFEDAAALIGLLIAALGIGLHQTTGSALPDAIGSILVGLLLGVVAVVLIDRNRRFLVGQAVPADIRQRILHLLLERSEVERITYLHLEFVGPSRVFLVAAVDMVGDQPEHDLAVRLRRLERDLEMQDFIEEAVLTLATADEKSLVVPEERGS